MHVFTNYGGCIIIIITKVFASWIYTPTILTDFGSVEPLLRFLYDCKSSLRNNCKSKIVYRGIPKREKLILSYLVVFQRKKIQQHICCLNETI